jgi:hypothetical protein
MCVTGWMRFQSLTDSKMTPQNSGYLTGTQSPLRTEWKPESIPEGSIALFGTTATFIRAACVSWIHNRISSLQHCPLLRETSPSHSRLPAAGADHRTKNRRHYHKVRTVVSHVSFDFSLRLVTFGDLSESCGRDSRGAECRCSARSIHLIPTGASTKHCLDAGPCLRTRSAEY